MCEILGSRASIAKEEEEEEKKEIHDFTYLCHHLFHLKPVSRGR
jgi:hypothetical protein